MERNRVLVVPSPYRRSISGSVALGVSGVPPSLWPAGRASDRHTPPPTPRHPVSPAHRHRCPPFLTLPQTPFLSSSRPQAFFRPKIPRDGLSLLTNAPGFFPPSEDVFILPEGYSHQGECQQGALPLPPPHPHTQRCPLASCWGGACPQSLPELFVVPTCLFLSSCLRFSPSDFGFLPFPGGVSDCGFVLLGNLCFHQFLKTCNYF